MATTSPVMFNTRWRPTGMDVVRGSAEAGLTDRDYNWSKAFTGVEGLQNAEYLGNGQYRLVRGQGDASPIYERTTATIGPDGKVQLGPWVQDTTETAFETFKEFAPALIAAGTFGAAAGLGPFAGLSGAGAGTGATAGAAGAAEGLGIVEAGLSGLAEGAAGVGGLSTGGGLSGLTAAGGAAAAGGATTGGLTLGGVRDGINIGRTLLTLGAGGAAASGGGSVNTQDRRDLAGLAGNAGEDLFGFAKDYLTGAAARQKETDATFDKLIAGFLDAQQKGAERGDVAWDAFVNDFLPAGQEFAQRALNYDTPGRRAQAVAEARAGVANEAAAQRAAQRRMLGRAGVQLSGGRALTLDNASRFAETKLSTGAARGAARDVETTGLKLLADAGQMGIPIAGISGQQSGQGIAAGSAAGAATGAKEATFNSTLNPALSLYGAATGATGTAGNILNGVAATQAQDRAADAAGWAGLGNLAGQVLTAGDDSVIGKWLLGG